MILKSISLLEQLSRTKPNLPHSQAHLEPPVHKIKLVQNNQSEPLAKAIDWDKFYAEDFESKAELAKQSTFLEVLQKKMKQEDISLFEYEYDPKPFKERKEHSKSNSTYPFNLELIETLNQDLEKFVKKDAMSPIKEKIIKPPKIPKNLSKNPIFKEIADVLGPSANLSAGKANSSSLEKVKSNEYVKDESDAIDKYKFKYDRVNARLQNESNREKIEKKILEIFSIVMNEPASGSSSNKFNLAKIFPTFLTDSKLEKPDPALIEAFHGEYGPDLEYRFVDKLPKDLRAKIISILFQQLIFKATLWNLLYPILIKIEKKGDEGLDSEERSMLFHAFPYLLNYSPEDCKKIVTIHCRNFPEEIKEFKTVYGVRPGIICPINPIEDWKFPVNLEFRKIKTQLMLTEPFQIANFKRTTIEILQSLTFLTEEELYQLINRPKVIEKVKVLQPKSVKEFPSKIKNMLNDITINMSKADRPVCLPELGEICKWFCKINNFPFHIKFLNRYRKEAVDSGNYDPYHFWLLEKSEVQPYEKKNPIIPTLRKFYPGIPSDMFDNIPVSRFVSFNRYIKDQNGNFFVRER